jgi:hypothetical protein
MTVSQQNPAKITHVDRPDLGETFADSVQSMVWDGQTVRAELCVTRYPDAPGTSAEAHRYPVCRLVLTPPAIVELSSRLQQVMLVLMQTGVLPPGKARPPKKA